MTILFAGSPAIAVPTLEYLHKQRGVALLLCKPDAPFGRKQVITPPATKIMAQQLGIAILQPTKLDNEVEAFIQEQKIDLLVCFAYGKIFKQSFLNLFPKGCINVHPSLLPLYRGPTPINSAILQGDSETGITVQKLALKMDSGDIILQHKIPLNDTETAGSLSETVANLAGRVLIEAIEKLEKGESLTLQKEEEATYCQLISKEDGKLDFNQEAITLERRIRAMNPSPGSFCFYKEQLLYFHRASVQNENISFQKKEIGVVSYQKKQGLIVNTAKGQLVVTQLQLAGKKILNYQDFMNGNPQILGEALS